MAGNEDRSQKIKLTLAITGLAVGLLLILLYLGIVPNPFASKPKADPVSQEMQQDFEKQQKRVEQEAKSRPPSGA